MSFTIFVYSRYSVFLGYEIKCFDIHIKDKLTILLDEKKGKYNTILHKTKKNYIYIDIRLDIIDMYDYDISITDFSISVVDAELYLSVSKGLPMFIRCLNMLCINYIKLK